MEITRESQRARWWIMTAVWIFVSAIAIWHAQVTRNYVALLSEVGRPGPENPTPLRRPLPANFADAQTWVRYALAAQQGDAWQLRHTEIDNAPFGRELHWNSALVQLIAAAGRIEQQRTGKSLPHATEDALAWFNLPILLGCVIGFSAWAAARAGAGAGVLLAVGMIGHRAFYNGFMPNYVDHHGLLTAATFGVVFGAILMGVGWWRESKEQPRLLPSSPQAAKRAAIASALCGAFGMGISAASTIPAIAITGLAGVAVAFLFGHRAKREGARFEPRLWQWWGRTGAIASLVFYGLEYAPGHLSLRLEVNHPFHALAWWGGGELIALIISWRLNGINARPRFSQVALPFLATLASPLTIVIAGTAAFVVRDPFVADLRHTVGEGMSFRAAVHAFGKNYAQGYLINFLVAGGGLWLVFLARRDRIVAAFVCFVSLAFVALSCWEIRWWLAASGPIVCVVLAAVAAAGPRLGRMGRWALVAVAGAVFLPSGAIENARLLQQASRDHSAADYDLMQPVYRDIAGILRASQPNGEIVLLASPDASSGIGYYGQFKAIGTLYWENTAGLKAAAEIFCAESDDEAQTKIRARGVTHLAMISRGSFIEEYFRLLHPQRAAGDVEKMFGHRLLVKQQIPRWLRLIPYRVPPNVSMPNLTTLLFQVVPEQTEIAATWNLACAQLAQRRPEVAEPLFVRAISAAATGERAALFKTAADLAYKERFAATAIRFYREALALGPNVHAAAELGWILASNSSPTVRNGREALALLEPYLRTHPNDILVLNAYAGALAETGRFTEASGVASRGLALLQTTGDTKAASVLQQRLNAYLANRPWHE